ncbi:amino acid permease [Candidatus Dependentiae bacterium]|nr:MAG: amino acid permease [Candidatus Dependentiae bacterium]
MSPNTEHKIGLATAIIIGMNAMIGLGIFTAPAALASHVGPASILSYIFVIVAIWFIANSLARLAKLFPEEGSFYLYAKQWGGHVVGMIAITGYCIGLFVGMGLLVRVIGNYLAYLFPAFSAMFLGSIALVLLVVLNMFGVELSKLGQHILIILTVLPIATITLLGLSKANITNLIPFAPYGFISVLKATRIVIFGFFGFECAASLFNIVKNPERNVPRALTYAILIVGTIYTLFVFSIIISIPANLLINPYEPITDILQKIFPEHIWLINVVHISILSAMIGTVHSMLWSSSHLLLLLVNKIKNPTLHNLRTLGILNQKTAVFMVGLLTGITFISFENINLFFNITAIGIVLAYLLSMITLLTIPSEWKSRHNIKTIIGIITALIIFFFATEELITEILKVI